MKNLIAELLVKLAEKDEAADEQTARLFALEFVVTSLIYRMNSVEFTSFVNGITDDIARFQPNGDNPAHSPELLQQHVQRLLQPKL